MTPAAAWTCPFCPLACDHLRVRAGAATLELDGGACPRASRALAQFGAAPGASEPEIDGAPVSPEAAASAAAALLAAAQQPLFGGLGTDVAGARALYPLACATGAICDPAGGAALMQGLRALQDRGQFTTTLAEVRTRADLIVFVGGVPEDVAPLVRERCGIGDPQVPQRQVVVLGGQGADDVPLQGDLFDTLGLLAALVALRPVAADAALQALARRLREARYAVLVGAPPTLPPQGALLIEAVHRIVNELNARTRAAALWIGGGNGSATVNQVFTWLGGLPLRSRAGPRGLEHEPQAFDAARLLAGGDADVLLWVASFDAASRPPETTVPLIVLGHPDLAASARRPGRRSVFFPVSTPGIGSDGHLFRTDGTVLMPLAAARRDSLPSVAAAAGAILQALRAGRPA